MESMILSTLAIFTVLYFFLGLGIYLGLRKSRKIAPESGFQGMVSIIVPVRNEMEHIGGLIECLSGQDYDHWEAIIVDDNSNDGTFKAAQALCQGDNRFKIIRAGDNTHGWGPKKNALDWGIKSASGEIILITDADCRPGKTWAAGMAKLFQADTVAVAGFSPLETSGTISGRWKALEALAAAIIGAGLMGWGKPFMVTGRNFAYRKEIYLKMGGFGEKGKLPAGDDDLLAQELGKYGKVVFSYNPQTFVKSLVSAGGYLKRKQRHFAVAKKFPPLFVALGLIVFGFFFSLLASFIYGMIFHAEGILLTATCAFAGKIIIDYIVLKYGAGRLQTEYKIGDFLLVELLQIPYTLILQPLSLPGKIEWKGRKL